MCCGACAKRNTAVVSFECHFGGLAFLSKGWPALSFFFWRGWCTLELQLPKLGVIMNFEFLVFWGLFQFLSLSLSLHQHQHPSILHARPAGSSPVVLPVLLVVGIRLVDLSSTGTLV